MAFISSNPIASTIMSSSPQAPSLDTRGLYPTAEGWVDIDSNGISKKIATENYVDTKDGSAVHITGNETVGGIKTFSLSPVVPIPTLDTHAVNKGFSDKQYAKVLNVNTDGSFVKIEDAEDNILFSSLKIKGTLKQDSLSSWDSVNALTPHCGDVIHSNSNAFNPDINTYAMCTMADGILTSVVPVGGYYSYIKADYLKGFIKAGKTYTFAVESDYDLTEENLMVVININSDVITPACDFGGKTVTFTVPDGKIIKEVWFYLSRQESPATVARIRTFYNIRFIEGSYTLSTLPPYEAHQGEYITIGENLSGIPKTYNPDGTVATWGAQDTIYVDRVNNKAWLQKNVYAKVFDGANDYCQGVITNATTLSFEYWIIKDYLDGVFNCEVGFKKPAISSIGNLTVDKKNVDGYEGITSNYNNSTVLYVCVNKSRLTGYSEEWSDSEKISAMNSYLGNNNFNNHTLTVYIQITNSSLTELSETITSQLLAMTSFSNITYMYSIPTLGDLPVFDVTYNGNLNIAYLNFVDDIIDLQARVAQLELV